MADLQQVGTAAVPSSSQPSIAPIATSPNFTRYTLSNGSFYVGPVRNDKPWGLGTLTHPDGSRYVGDFVTGAKHGIGTEFAPDGSVRRAGRWDNDFYVGPSMSPINPNREQQSVRISSPERVSQASTVRLLADGGTFKVPVRLNGVLTLNFTVDSGASDVTVPADVVLTLVRTGTITSDDFIGEQTYRLADGRTIQSSVFRIRELKVGEKYAYNVRGSVADVQGSLLLGQSFLGQFSRVSFDNANQRLILE
jgi:hypothetical protein